ncbi:hypothetical protein ACWD4N_43005 [Streptomyces sp. NPDC002586]
MAATALSACGTSSDKDSGGDKAAQTTADVSRVAKQYMTAWMSKPSQPDTMCTLETKAARPNFTKDGGTLKGCTAAYTDMFKDQDPNSAPLTVAISKVQDVKASAGQPAGKGALATCKRPGRDAFRYALRLVQEDGQWRISQKAEADEDQYAHTADPVADVLARAS